MTQRNVSISDRSRHKLLHVEAPGCIINIRVGLRDGQGRKVTAVSISADGARYAGDPEWWVEGVRGTDGQTLRIIQVERASVKADA